MDVVLTTDPKSLVRLYHNFQYTAQYAGDLPDCGGAAASMGIGGFWTVRFAPSRKVQRSPA